MSGNNWKSYQQSTPRLNYPLPTNLTTTPSPQQNQNNNIDDQFNYILKTYGLYDDYKKSLQIDNIKTTKIISDLHRSFKNKVEKTKALLYSISINNNNNNNNQSNIKNNNNNNNYINPKQQTYPKRTQEELQSYDALFGFPVTANQFRINGAGNACATLSIAVIEQVAQIWKLTKNNYTDFKSKLPEINWQIVTQRGIDIYKQWYFKYGKINGNNMPQDAELSDICKNWFKNMKFENESMGTRISLKNIKETLDTLILCSKSIDKCIGISFTHSNSTWAMIALPFSYNNNNNIMRVVIYDSHGSMVENSAYIAGFEVKYQTDNIAKYIHKVLTSGEDYDDERYIVEKFGNVNGHDIMEVEPQIAYSAVKLTWD